MRKTFLIHTKQGFLKGSIKNELIFTDRMDEAIMCRSGEKAGEIAKVFEVINYLIVEYYELCDFR